MLFVRTAYPGAATVTAGELFSVASSLTIARKHFAPITEKDAQLL